MFLGKKHTSLLDNQMKDANFVKVWLQQKTWKVCKIEYVMSYEGSN